MKTKILLTALLIGLTGFLFAQSNLKIVEYKILKFEKKVAGEYTVPKGQTWKIESVVGSNDDKMIFIVDDVELLLYYSLHNGVTDKFLPFYLPENTTFSLKPAGDNIVFSIAVLKIE